jgi:lysophospholipase L1-like esterase
MTYRIAVLGDSVTWGQGLPDTAKIHALVASACPPPVEIVPIGAHSGAVIGVCGRRVKTAVNGEVPTGYPSILQQCDGFVADPGSVDLVLLNGGINDIDIRFILNPLTEIDDLRDAIERACFCDLRELLRRVAAKFSKPSARIVVTSYYPVLSPESRLTLGGEFLMTLGVPVGNFSALMSGLPLWDKVLANCDVFFRDSTDAMRRAIAAVNDPRIRLAAPPFTAANAALASDPWLFGINWNLTPQDPMAAARHAACRLDEPDPIRREQCFRASAGHPNVKGARQFADAVLAVLT